MPLGVKNDECGHDLAFAITSPLNSYARLGKERSMLVCKGITKSFGGLVALRNVSLEIKEGEIVGLIGPNGSGKTTLFNVICGIYRPDKGAVYFKGRDITGRKPYEICKLGIGRTFQLVKPFRTMTVLENVMTATLFGRSKFITMTEARKQALKLLDFVGLSDMKNRVAGELGIASLRLLEIARALATEPELLLLDEVMAGLNPVEVSRVGALVEKVRRDLGITIFWVEHVMRAIMKHADRVIVLDRGERIAEGTPKEIAQDEKVIKAYLGEPYA